MSTGAPQVVARPAAGMRWIALRPGAPPAPRRQRRRLSPTPRYPANPGWGLVDYGRRTIPQQQPDSVGGPSEAWVRAALNATAVVLGIAALVMLTGPIQQDKEITVQIDLDDTDLHPIGVEASVDWCTQRDEKTWIASLTFKPLSPENDTILNAFLEELKHRAPGSRPPQ